MSGAIRRFAIFWTAAIALQWAQGAYRADRPENPDEAAHIVTGLMARQYLASGAARSPMEFARDYYLHYPKVALGHWPPVFYVEQAAWTLIFPASRASLLVMLALQLAVLASLLWIVLRDRFGPAAAWAGAVVLETLPGMVEATGSVLTEVAVALLIFLAALAWVRFLEGGSARSAAVFGVCSAAAILAKATAIALAPVPLLSVLLLGRADLLRRARFWLPAVIVAGICIPWHLLAPGSMHERAMAYGGPGILTRRMLLPWIDWGPPLGRPVAVLATLGLAALLWRRLQGLRPDAVLATAAAAVIGATLGRWSFRVWDTRHFTETAPLFVLLALSGSAWIAAWPVWRRTSLRHAGPVIALSASLFIAAWNLYPMLSRQPAGYRRLAAFIVDGAAGHAAAILVAGDAGAEGALIAEIAQREPSPRRFAVRATKLFVEVTWSGKVKRIRAGNREEVYALLTSLPVDLVVIDSVHRSPYDYQSQLEQALAEHPQSWARLDLPELRPGLIAVRRLDPLQLADAERASSLRAALPVPVP
jgi:4-amino-4-deoxy-L-arabinose transferase-like glycosyltransferase